MYENYLALLEATLAKYENAQSLCCVPTDNNDFRPVYTHANGIGCAIGCHLTAEQAQQLDALCDPEGVYGWRDICERDDARALVGDIFDKIDVEDMAELQAMHDLAAGVNDYGPKRVAEFRAELKSKIALLEMAE